MKKSKRILSLFLLCGMLFLGVTQGFSSNAAVGTVTSYRQITWGLSSGLYAVNGIPAFCSEYLKDCPTVGTQIISIEECDNSVIRKALYYGYNGPGNVLGVNEEAFILTSIAISNANIGEANTGVKEKYDVFYWDIVNHPEKYIEPPEHFKAYLAHPSKASMQRLAFYILEERGYVEAVKKSSNEEISVGNTCYSLKNAVYEIYSKETMEAESKVGMLVTDEEGKSNRLTLPIGTYYAKETQAPNGYELSEEIVSFDIQADHVVTLEMFDDPRVNAISLLLQKVDAKTMEGKDGSMVGAEFLVKYYPSYEIEGLEPIKTWTCTTDEKGCVYLNEDVPLGTLTIQEVKAPKGYQINPEVFVKKISSDSYEYLIVKEEKLPPFRLQVEKKDTYGNCLEGAEFTLYKDETCQKEVAKGVTNQEGMLTFTDLEVCKNYYLKETKAPTGYFEEETIYSVYSEESKDFHLEILNEPEIVLPKTGSTLTMGIPLLGISLCSISLYFMKKKRRKCI